MANELALQLTSLFLPDLDLKGYNADNVALFTPSAGVLLAGNPLANITLTLDQPVDLEETGLTSSITLPSQNSSFYLLGDTASATYHVTAAVVTDASGASARYDAAALAAAGLSTDFTIGRSDIDGDHERPELSSVTLPSNVVTSTAGTDTTFQFSARDVGGSDIASATITLDRPVQTASGSVNTLSFNNFTTYGYANASLAITSETEAGSYHLVAATVTDTAGNTRSYNASSLSNYTPFTVDDKTLPVLTSLKIAPLDVTTFDAGLNVSATVSDAASNATSVRLTLDRSLTELGYSGHGAHSTIDTNTLVLSAAYGMKDAFSVGATVDMTTAPGTYTVTQAVVSDAAGNSTTYSTADLEKLGFDHTLTVKTDSISPVLNSLTLPSFTAGGSANGTISVAATDPSPSNGYLYAVVNLDHPIASSGYAGVYLNADARSLLPGPNAAFASGTTSSTSVTASADQSPIYNVTSVALIDRAGNEVDYSAAQLQHMGFSTQFVTNSAMLFTATANAETMVAPVSGQAYFKGDASGASVVALNGNVVDYTLSRLQPNSGSLGAAQVGAFVLTANNGSGTYTIEQSVGAVRFQNGQSLALHDLPVYLTGSSALAYGGPGHDDFVQNSNEAYQVFAGNGGVDDVYLKGNAQDYTLRSFAGQTAAVPWSGLPSTHIAGLELVAKNGSGALLIDNSIETLHFKDGQYLSYGDVSAYVAVDAQPVDASVAIAPEGLPLLPPAFETAGSRALVDGVASDYTVSRAYNGAFVLSHADTSGSYLTLAQTVGGVQFGNGQFLSLQDLSAYMPGSDVFTVGTSGDDILKVRSSGDQYVYGGEGNDTLFLHGNARDYTIEAVKLGYDSSTGQMAIDGYELLAKNLSGNILIDKSVETLVFQDGQSTSLAALPAAILSAGNPFGSAEHDVFYQNLSEAYQVFVGGGGTDQLYLNGNTQDYTLRPFEGDTAAIAGIGLSPVHVAGFELVSTNGSGALLVDQSVETIHFQNGQYLSYGDLAAYVAAAPNSATDHLEIGVAGGSTAAQTFDTPGARALLNGNADDYTLARADTGAFVLAAKAASGAEITLGQSVGGVQFADGSILALHDLATRVAGSDIFTVGTASDDILKVGLTGDQYVIGGGGTDALYIHGNAQDYTIASVNLAEDTAAAHPAIAGYELFANNGSGNIYIDASVETLHLQDGQSIEVQNLAAFFQEHHV